MFETELEKICQSCELSGDEFVEGLKTLKNSTNKEQAMEAQMELDMFISVAEYPQFLMLMADHKQRMAN